MIKILLLIFMSVVLNLLSAQQVSTAAGNTQMSEFSAEWIIGGSLFDNSLFLESETADMLYYDTTTVGFIDVYPSLTRDFLNIVRKNDSCPIMDYTISNYMGINMIKGTLNSGTHIELDVKGLSAGYYFITFIEPEHPKCLFIKKFLKL